MMALSFLGVASDDARLSRMVPQQLHVLPHEEQHQHGGGEQLHLMQLADQLQTRVEAGCCFLSSSDLVSLDMVQLMPSSEDSDSAASVSAALDVCIDDFGDVPHLAGEAALQMYETYCAIDADVAETAAAVEAVVAQNTHWKEIGPDKVEDQAVALPCSTSSSAPSTSSSSSSSAPSLCDSDLLSLSVRELNKRLRAMPKDQAQRVKRRRRTLKNRNYAQSCRSKRHHQRQDLQSLNTTLQKELRAANDEIYRLREELDHLKRTMQQANHVLHLQ